MSKYEVGQVLQTTIGVGQDWEQTVDAFRVQALDDAGRVSEAECLHFGGSVALKEVFEVIGAASATLVHSETERDVIVLSYGHKATSTYYDEGRDYTAV